jgi:NhaA family Na+:H+ antiporter
VSDQNIPRFTNPPGWNLPVTLSPARELVKRILAPVQRFIAVEAASGIVLVVAAIGALFWANSPWRTAYDHFWNIPIGFRVGAFVFERELHFWINDGLMTLFFFVVGLEIRRELHCGELSGIRRAALPLSAALGGMLAPAGIFLALNAGRQSIVGWAVPMATDIAFAVGVFALLGKRVAPTLRILLLALAVIDDVGAILVIALFYSSGVVITGFYIVGLGIAAIVVMQNLRIRSTFAYVAPGIVVWAGAYIGGIHPTLAGVIIGLMTPVEAWFGTERFLNQTEYLQSLRDNGVPSERELLPHLNTLQNVTHEAISPAERLQHLLHSWVAFGIMPLFAFANAGVSLSKISFDGDALWVFWGVMVGRVVGKPLGIWGLSRLAERVGLAARPGGVQWRDVGVVGIVGGIGFTMALFIAELAFHTGQLLETSKLAILCASGLSGILSFLAGYRILKVPQAGTRASESGAAASTTT